MKPIAKLICTSLLLTSGVVWLGFCLDPAPAASYKSTADNGVSADPGVEDSRIQKRKEQSAKAMRTQTSSTGRNSSHMHQMIASDVPMSAPHVQSNDDPLPKPTRPLLSAVMDTTVKAPQSFVWTILTDFSLYPQIFPKIESVKVTKRTGNYVYTESYLKPQLFIHEQRQRIVNDLSGKPNQLRWSMLDGNFECTQGCWELTPANNGRECNVKYTLQSTAEPIPKAIAGLTLKMVQKDIVKTFKKTTEKLYQVRITQAQHSSPVATIPGGGSAHSAPLNAEPRSDD